VRADREPILEPTMPPPRMATGVRAVILDGLWGQNPIAVQILGICSALAVTSRLETAIVMGLAVTFVCAGSSFVISLARNLVPARIRLIVWVCLIGTFVIFVDQLCRAFLWEISLQLGPYVGLIITNCILLGRAEAFASRNGPLLSALDGAACGVGYAAVLCLLGVFREIFGTGRIELAHLFGRPVMLANIGHGYVANDFLILASGAFIALGFLVALFNHLGRRRARRA
jgi:Na+-transporting NADH:ubiquinone oxidoreductase subunit D